METKSILRLSRGGEGTVFAPHLILAYLESLSVADDQALQAHLLRSFAALSSSPTSSVSRGWRRGFRGGR